MTMRDIRWPGKTRPKCANCGSGMDPWGCVKCGHTKAAKIENPAWDYIQRVPPDELMGGFMSNGRFQPTNFEIRDRDSAHPEFVGHRSRVTARWTWAIPDPETLEFIVKTLDGRPVVEIGAGNGYWAWLLTQMGVDIVAYDRAPIGHDDTWFPTLNDDHQGRWDQPIEPIEFFPVQEGDTEVLSLLDDCADRVLFLCWPNYDSDFAYDAMKAFRGDTVIYIGEHHGCNANWKFFSLVEPSGRDPDDPDDRPYGAPDDAEVPTQEWEEVDSFPIVQWGGIHDQVSIYKRKT